MMKPRTSEFAKSRRLAVVAAALCRRALSGSAPTQQGGYRTSASVYGMVSRVVCVMLVAGLVCSSRVAFGDIPVDWLAYTAGADRTHFDLRSDQGIAFAQAGLNIVSGTLPPFTPAAGSLGASFWVTPPDFADSVLGDTTMATTKIQVAPQAGGVNYQLAITGADLSGMYFSIGQLFGTTMAGTRQVNIFALTSLGQSVPVDFFSTNGWDDGIRFYTQPLLWDASFQTLSLAPSANGESEFAFFRIPTSTEPITQLLFDIPNGYNAGVGDALEFGFALPVVPEPGSVALCVQGMAICAFVFRRVWRRRLNIPHLAGSRTELSVNLSDVSEKHPYLIGRFGKRRFLVA